MLVMNASEAPKLWGQRRGCAKVFVNAALTRNFAHGLHVLVMPLALG